MGLTMKEKRVITKEVAERYRKVSKKGKGTIRVHEALRKIWAIMDHIWGKRLAPVLKDVVIRLQRHKEIVLDEETRKKLLKISAASIDRLLAPDRKKLTLKGKSHTKPGTLLKHQIPIRTFADWDGKRSWFVEIDLVGHDGGSTSGDYLQKPESGRNTPLFIDNSYRTNPSVFH
jgi:hypothetical protein